jgi:hypothetical protein
LRRKHNIYAACFFLHLALILLASGRHALFIAAQGGTLLPRAWDPSLRRVEAISTAALGEDFDASNPLRQVIAGYTRCAGTEIGYGFFAPTPAAMYKLVFELKYPDGRVEYELPHVGAAATGLRLTLLYQNIARIPYGAARETILKLMAFSIWREHSDVSVTRAVFGVVNLPSLSQFERGEKESYEVVYAYDFYFSLPVEPMKP